MFNHDLNETKEITATVSPTDTTDTPTWSIIEGNDGVNIIPNNNKVTVSPIKEGEATIQVKYNDNTKETASIEPSPPSAIGKYLAWIFG